MKRHRVYVEPLRQEGTTSVMALVHENIGYRIFATITQRQYKAALKRCGAEPHETLRIAPVGHLPGGMQTVDVVGRFGETWRTID